MLLLLNVEGKMVRCYHDGDYVLDCVSDKDDWQIISTNYSLKDGILRKLCTIRNTKGDTKSNVNVRSLRFSRCGKNSAKTARTIVDVAVRIGQGDAGPFDAVAPVRPKPAPIYFDSNEDYGTDICNNVATYCEDDILSSYWRTDSEDIDNTMNFIVNQELINDFGPIQGLSHKHWLKLSGKEAIVPNTGRKRVHGKFEHGVNLNVRSLL